jgi:hypothetical protein
MNQNVGRTPRPRGTLSPLFHPRHTTLTTNSPNSLNHLRIQPGSAVL